jgi:hypothetical protein
MSQVSVVLTALSAVLKACDSKTASIKKDLKAVIGFYEFRIHAVSIIASRTFLLSFSDAITSKKSTTWFAYYLPFILSHFLSFTFETVTPVSLLHLKKL